MKCSQDSRFTCDWIFNILVVLSDGKVVCGCADPFGARPLGDLNKSEIMDIWHSPLVRDIRRGLNEGHSCFCHDCGLKRPLTPGEPVPQQPIQLEILPRIFFEPTVQCNLSCYQAVCGYDSGIVKSRSRPQYPLDEFNNLINQIGNQLVRLDFFNYGDPFVHPQAVDMVECIKKKYPNIYLYTSTNGLLLNSEKIKRLVQSGMDEITFSVDGPNQKIYRKYRINGDFKRVLSLMSELIAERNRLGREIPYINWRYIIFNWNDSRKTMRQTVKLAGRIGVDRLSWEITDHPEEGKSDKYQPGTRPWKKIRPDIWDTSQIGNAIPGKRFRASLKLPSGEITAEVDREQKVMVKTKNSGGAIWLKQTYSGRRIIRLGAQLFSLDRQLIELNFARSGLAESMKRGETQMIEIILPGINIPGIYWLKFDMVSEGIDWFESGGSTVLWQKLTVQSQPIHHKLI